MRLPTLRTWQRLRIWTSLRSIWLRRTFLPNSFDQRKRFGSPKRQFGCKGDQRSFYAEWCDTLSWLHYTMSMQTLLSAIYLGMRGAVILHVRKLQSYCSLRASKADPRPSNFVSATDFKQKARSGSTFLLFPELNYLCYIFHLQIAPETISEGLKSKRNSCRHAPDTPGGA